MGEATSLALLSFSTHQHVIKLLERAKLNLQSVEIDTSFVPGATRITRQATDTLNGPPHSTSHYQ